MIIYKYRGYTITQPETSKLIVRKGMTYKAEIETNHKWTIDEMRWLIDHHQDELEGEK